MNGGMHLAVVPRLMQNLEISHRYSPSGQQLLELESKMSALSSCLMAGPGVHRECSEIPQYGANGKYLSMTSSYWVAINWLSHQPQISR